LHRRRPVPILVPTFGADRQPAIWHLLNAGHPDNGGKAAFFEALAFSRAEPGLLVEALRGIAGGDTAGRVTSDHGDKYVIDAALASPGDRIGLVRTVWIVDRGTTTPRFVAAYPRE
jgi:Domain of unknown function (DUF6883)